MRCSERRADAVHRSGREAGRRGAPPLDRRVPGQTDVRAHQTRSRRSPNSTEFTVIKAAGPRRRSVLARKSGQPLTTGIPGLFTYRGYHEFFKSHLELRADGGLERGLGARASKPAGVAHADSAGAGRSKKALFRRVHQQMGDVARRHHGRPYAEPGPRHGRCSISWRDRIRRCASFCEAAANETSLSSRSQSVAGHPNSPRSSARRWSGRRSVKVKRRRSTRGSQGCGRR